MGITPSLELEYLYLIILKMQYEIHGKLCDIFKLSIFILVIQFFHNKERYAPIRCRPLP